MPERLQSAILEYYLGAYLPQVIMQYPPRGDTLDFFFFALSIHLLIVVAFYAAASEIKSWKASLTFIHTVVIRKKLISLPDSSFPSSVVCRQTRKMVLLLLVSGSVLQISGFLNGLPLTRSAHCSKRGIIDINEQIVRLH